MRRLKFPLLLLPLLVVAGEPPRGTLKGHLDGKDGNPAAGASLLAISADGGFARGAISGRGGFFVFTDLPGGKYQLFARAGDRTLQTDAVVKPPFAADIRMHFGQADQLTASTARAIVPVKVRVTALSGDATIPNARVYLLSDREEFSTGVATGSDGVATFSLMNPGYFRIVIEATGFRLYETPKIQLLRDLSAEVQLVPDSTDFPFEPRSHLPPPAPASAPAPAAASAPAATVASAPR